MKTGFKVAVFLLLSGIGVFAGDVLDRIVATVNGHAILLSDCEEALHHEALVNGRPLAAITMADRQAALNRLIDQELLREQMEGLSYRHASPQEIQKQVLAIRQQLPGTATDDDWRRMLATYGFTEAEFTDRIAVQIEILRFLDLRLRPSVHISADAVEAYYREKFLPDLRRAGGTELPLTEVAPRIEELLVQQRMDELLNDWIRNLRQQSRIRETGFGPVPERTRDLQ